MKKLFLHVKRLFKKFWFIIFLAFAISPIMGIGVLMLMTIISMLFFSDPVDVDAILDNFTERELEIIFAETMDENVTDDEYLEILARYQSYLCPKKVDYLTTWMGSEVNSEAYIWFYEVKREVGCLEKDRLKKSILTSINKNNVHAQRVVNSHRNMVFRYTNKKTAESFDIVISHEELKA